MITIHQTNILRGPNVWARVPVVHMRVAVDGDEHSSRGESDLTNRLLRDLPSLEEHRCTMGRPGGFVAALRDGTSLAHVVEHVALAIQRLAGVHVSRGLTQPAGKAGLYHVVYAYRQEDVGRAAGQLAVEYLNNLLQDCAANHDLSHQVEDVIRIADRLAYGPSTLDIVSEAERRGIPVLRLHPDTSLVQLGHGRYQRRIWATRTSATSGVAIDIAGNKELTNLLLRDLGIPSPAGIVARSAAEAVPAATRLGFPVALKPLDGNHGRGVCLNLENASHVRRQFPHAMSES